jgi:hypothetical protein
VDVAEGALAVGRKSRQTGGPDGGDRKESNIFNIDIAAKIHVFLESPLAPCAAPLAPSRCVRAPDQTTAGLLRIKVAAIAKLRWDAKAAFRPTGFWSSVKR